MKKVTGLFLVFGFVLAFPVLKLHAQNTFEGTMTWSMTAPQMGDDSHPMIINVKGDKTESEVDLGTMGNIKTYSDNKKIYMVMGAMKTGYIMDKTPDKAIKNKLDSLDLKRTGQKATIAGHPAEEYLLKGMKGGAEVSIWVAGDFPKKIRESFYHSLNNNPGEDPAQLKAMMQLADRGLVPVRIVVKRDGEMQMTTEFVKYEEKSLADALFVPPADVKFGPMPKMPGGTN